MDSASAQYWVGAAAALVAFTFVILILAVGWRHTASRRIAAVIVLETMLFTSQPFATLQRLGVDADLFKPLDVFTPWALAAAYLWLLSLLGTRLLRPLNSRAGRLALLAYPFLVGAILWRWNSEEWIGAIIGVHVLFAAFIGLAVSIVAYRATTTGTLAHARAKWFLIAFGTRDGLFVAIILTSLANALIFHVPDSAVPDPGLLSNIVIMAYVPLLAYGILRTQLFDLDLKVKIGIKRGTVAATFVILIFIAFQIAQLYLNKTFGIVAGGIMTGLLLFLSPRLNKMADRVSDTAMPKVQPTPNYIAFKKCEVYRAAIESAYETGGITEKERASLERLRGKLSLTTADANAIRDEVEEAARSGHAAPLSP